MVDLIGLIQESYLYFYNQISGIVGEIYLQLIIFTIGLFVYAFFVWHFYRTLSKRDIFKIDLEKYNLPTAKHKTLGKVWSSFIYILKYGFIFPIYIFLWFSILSLFLLILSEEIAVTHIILTSAVIVSSIRVAAYYKEELSVDLAKLIPFAFLAILLTDPNFFSVEITIQRLSDVTIFWSEILRILIFSILLEWFLRIFYLIKREVSK